MHHEEKAWRSKIRERRMGLRQQKAGVRNALRIVSTATRSMIEVMLVMQSSGIIDGETIALKEWGLSEISSGESFARTFSFNFWALLYI